MQHERDAGRVSMPSWIFARWDHMPADQRVCCGQRRVWRRHGVHKHRAWADAVHVQRADDVQQGHEQLWTARGIGIDRISSWGGDWDRAGCGMRVRCVGECVQVADSAAGEGWAALGKSVTMMAALVHVARRDTRRAMRLA